MYILGIRNCQQMGQPADSLLALLDTPPRNVYLTPCEGQSKRHRVSVFGGWKYKGTIGLTYTSVSLKNWFKAVLQGRQKYKN